MRQCVAAMTLMEEHIGSDAFTKYGVERYFTEFGLSVGTDYRRRKIGEHLLRARSVNLVYFATAKDLQVCVFPRNEVCAVFGFELTSIWFTSDDSDRCGANAGMFLEGELTWGEIEKRDSKLTFPNIRSRALTVRSLRMN